MFLFLQDTDYPVMKFECEKCDYVNTQKYYFKNTSRFVADSEYQKAPVSRGEYLSKESEYKKAPSKLNEF